MNPKKLCGPFVLLAAALALAACERKKETTVAVPPAAKAAAPASVAAPAPKLPVKLVGGAERSRHFLPVASHLELGGTVFAYLDIDGDAKTLAGNAKRALANLPGEKLPVQVAVQEHLEEIVEILGFDGVKAIGVSSVPDGAGFFRNSTFLYTPEGRLGLLEWAAPRSRSRI